MKKYIILIISILIDGIIPNLTLFNFNNLTYFTPLCTVTSLVIIYSDKSFVSLFLFSSIIYGTLYINNLLVAFTSFYIILLIIKYFKKIFEDNLIIILLECILIIFIYEFIQFLIYSLGTFNLNDYFYKVVHSLFFNILYAITIFYIYDKKGSKLKY